MAWDATKPNSAEAKSLYPAQQQANNAAIENWLNDIGNFPTTPALFTGGIPAGQLPLTIGKVANQTVNNSTVLVNDTHLVLSVFANHVYLVELFLLLQAAANTSDWKFGWALPAGATFAWAPSSFANATGLSYGGPHWGANVVGGADPQAMLAVGDTLSIASAGNVHALSIIGLAYTAGTAGNIQFKWAQDTAEVSDNIILLGSTMRITITV